MPVYQVTDPANGHTLQLTGDAPPSEQDLNTIFAQTHGPAAPAPAPSSAAPSSGGGVMGFLSNAVSDAGQVGSGLLNAVEHPINTIRTTAGLINGLTEKGGRLAAQAATGNQYEALPNEQTLNAFGSQLKQEYGSLPAIGQSLSQHPIRTALDAATLLSGLGEGLSVAGKASDIAALSKVGETAHALSDTINPVNQAGNAISKLTGGASNLAAGSQGIATGAGATAVKQAFTNGSDDLKAGLRGQVTPEQAVGDIRDAVSSVADQRRLAYQTQMSQAQAFKQPLDITPVSSAITDPESGLMRSFGVTLGSVDNATGRATLDFTHSSIPADEQGTITDIVNKVGHYMDNPQEATVENIDNLKKYVDDTYSQSKQSRAFIQGVKSNVRDVLNQVPGYQEATSSYAQASKLLDNLKAITGTDKTAMTTVFNRVLSTVKNDKQAGIDLLDQLGQASGKDVVGQMSGVLLHSWLPESLISRGLGAVGALSHNPLTLLTSPRVTGEVGQLVRPAVGAAKKASLAVTTASKNAPALSLLQHLGSLKP